MKRFSQKFFGGFLFLSTMLLTSFLLNAGKAHARVYPNPPLGPAPASITYAVDYCDDFYNPKTSSVVQWASVAGSPGSGTVYVDYGTNTVNLQLNYFSTVCKQYGPNSNESVLAAARAVFTNFSSGLGGQITQPGGNVAYVNMTSFYGPGNYYTKNTSRRATIPFTYSRPGGFVQNENITVRFSSRTVGHYKRPRDDRNLFACVNPLGTPQPNPGPTNINDYGRCTIIKPGFTVGVKIKPHDPVGKFSVTCEPENGRVKISGEVRDPNLPGQKILSSFGIVGESGLVDGPFRRGPTFTFYTTDARLMDGNAHWLRYYVYDDNIAANGYHIINDINSPNNNFPDQKVQCPKLTQDSECIAFAGGYGLPNGSSVNKVVVRDINRNELSNNNVQPGQKLTVGVSMKNTGTTTWSGNTSRYALTTTSGAVASAPAPYSTWSVNDAANPKRIHFQNTSATVSPNGDVHFWFQLTVPPEEKGGSYNLSFRMRQVGEYQSRSAQTFGGTCSATLNIPENRPYLSVGGGDVYSGATFGSKALDESGSSYSCEPTTSAQKASIQTNGFYDKNATSATNKRGSSSSQYATFASGNIGENEESGSPASPSDNFLANFDYRRSGMTTTKDVLFANLWLGDGGDPAGAYGNFHDGSNEPTMPCVDIRDDEAAVDGALDSSEVIGFLEADESGVKKVSGDVKIGDRLYIPGYGNQKTVIIDGDLTLGSRIEYLTGPGDMYLGAGSVPKVKLIAKNIYIEYQANKIDVDLVAMPTPHATNGDIQENGIIDTCSNYINSTPGGWFPSSGPNTAKIYSCGYKAGDGLALTGSVSARRILWKRTFGTLGTQSEVANTLCYFGNPATNTSKEGIVQRYKECAAELVDTSPLSVANELKNMNQNQNIPTSTVELPPVY